MKVSEDMKPESRTHGLKRILFLSIGLAVTAVVLASCGSSITGTYEHILTLSAKSPDTVQLRDDGTFAYVFHEPRAPIPDFEGLWRGSSTKVKFFLSAGQPWLTATWRDDVLRFPDGAGFGSSDQCIPCRAT